MRGIRNAKNYISLTIRIICLETFILYHCSHYPLVIIFRTKTTQSCTIQLTSFYYFAYFLPNTTLITAFSNQFFKLNLLTDMRLIVQDLLSMVLRQNLMIRRAMGGGFICSPLL